MKHYFPLCEIRKSGLKRDAVTSQFKRVDDETITIVLNSFQGMTILFILSRIQIRFLYPFIFNHSMKFFSNSSTRSFVIIYNRFCFIFKFNVKVSNERLLIIFIINDEILTRRYNGRYYSHFYYLTTNSINLKCLLYRLLIDDHISYHFYLTLLSSFKKRNNPTIIDYPEDRNVGHIFIYYT